MIPTTVFVGGSRAISAIPAIIEPRLQQILLRNHAVVLGDAPGADTCVQRFFADQGYANVTVYHSGQHCRTNVGRWPCCSIEAEGRPGTAAFYTVKDTAMTEVASHGLMLWDKASKGTLANVIRLLNQGKPLLLYLRSERTAITVRSIPDLEGLIPHHLTASLY